MPTWSIHVRPCPAVLRCHPSFVKVRCDWSIRVASVLCSFDLVCLSVLGDVRSEWIDPRVTCALQFLTNFARFLHCSLWLVDSRVICALHLSFYTVHGVWFIHVPPVLNRYFGSKTRDSRMLHPHSVCFVDCVRFCWTAGSVRTGGVDQSD